MMSPLAGILFVAVTAACFEDRYLCSTDAQCDLGVGGRCAPDGLCTAYDAECATERRYSAHAGERSGTCFEDAIELVNPCAAGQPPALERDCAATVCDALPACCTTGWSEACVREAQQACELACETEIAITAIRPAGRALWRLRWVPGAKAWTATASDHEVFLAWLAPPPGELEPRLAGFADQGASLVVGDRHYPLAGARPYASVTSVDLDRDGRDTVALAYEIEPPARAAVVALELGSGSSRELPITASEHLTWGDDDRDGFPDGIAGSNNRYTLLDNFDGEGHVRALASATSNTVPQGAPALRGFDWLDLDGDRRLDLAVFGNIVRLHTGEERIRDTALFSLDCEPPRRDVSTCMPDEVAFAGAALPTAAGPGLVLSSIPTRGAWRVAIGDGVPTVTAIPFATPCATCAPILAVVTRDLDGDGVLDIVGIDDRLGVYTALSTGDGKLTRSLPIPDPGAELVTIETSVSGRPVSP